MNKGIEDNSIYSNPEALNIEWDIFFNALVHPTLILNSSQIVLAANPMAQDLIDLPKDEIYGVECFKLIHDSQSDEPPANCPLKLLLNKGITETVEMEMEIFDKYGLVSCTPIFDENKNLEFIIHLITDITDRKIIENELEQSLNEKELLLKEIHHRVKNNMQVISSLLDLQSLYLKDKEDKNLFRDSKSRVRTMAILHEKLYQSDDFGNIDLEDYIRSIIANLFSAYYVDPSSLKFDLKVEDSFKLDIEIAIPLGLLITELVTNSIKYAFTEGNEGIIKIKSSKKGQYLTLLISDDGVGIPENVDLITDKTLGLQLVTNLTQQLNGKINLKRDKGTEFKLVFPTNEF